MSGMPMLLFMSPEAAKGLALIISVGLYLFFGWIWPIIKIRDKNTKTKSGWVMMLIIVGILPILAPLIMGVMATRSNAGVNAAAGTSMNASPGPQPVAGVNEMRGALPTNRPSAAY
jgi:hypothetical protein